MATNPLGAQCARFNLTSAIANGAFPKLESRDQVEDMIEQLIALLDASDGDPDGEEDNVDCCEAYDDRPYSIGSTGYAYVCGDIDDTEDDAPPMALAHPFKRVPCVGANVGADFLDQ